jgi:hypothetical protein
MDQENYLSNEDLLNIYALIVGEEQYFLKEHQIRVAFYSSIITLLFGGTVAALFEATQWYHIMFLALGPVLIIVISALAMDGTSRYYQRFLEAVTIKAKLQEKLGLTKEPYSEKYRCSYWSSESYIPVRHIESRKNYESSLSFVEDHSRKGYQLYVIRLFRCFQILGILMLVMLIIILYLFNSSAHSSNVLSKPSQEDFELPSEGQIHSVDSQSEERYQITQISLQGILRNPLTIIRQYLDSNVKS